MRSGSPADRAGIAAGDVITKLENLALATDGTMREYCDVLRNRGDLPAVRPDHRRHRGDPGRGARRVEPGRRHPVRRSRRDPPRRRARRPGPAVSGRSSS
ncbi:PDZ domain-containing protein [Pseudonocardia sp.]|uniref:PDZ domain-containing protein n=1 Tax=Pseudonocardia sp. TaxID=60912 RepID=UPI0039C8E81D